MNVEILTPSFGAIMEDNSEAALGWETVRENITTAERLRFTIGIPYVIGKYLWDFTDSYVFGTMRATNNWWDVFFVMGGIKKKSNILLKDGTEFMFTKPLFGLLRARTDLINSKQRKWRRVKIAEKDGRVQITVMGKRLVVDKDYSEQIANELDAEEGSYATMDIKGNDVIDIGCYVGDTALYFAIVRGAKHVYTYEPFPRIYNVAKKVVKENGLDKKITVVNAAIAGERGFTKINDTTTNFGAVGKASGYGRGRKRVPMLTLDDLVKQLKLKRATIKVDCEGAEYEIFKNVSSETLRVFDTIYIEYHYGYKTIVDRLRSEGYDVTYKKPDYLFANILSTKGILALGVIWAKRKTKKAQ